MGDGDGRAPVLRHEFVKRLLHHPLTLVVEGARRFVKQHDGGLAHEGARDRDALLLPARQLPAAQAHLCAVARAKVARDEAVGIRGASRFFNLALINALFAVTNILCDRALEEHRLLPHQPKLGAEPAQVERADVDAVEGDRAALRVVEALEQRDESRLAAAGRAAERARLPRANLERVAVADEVLGRGGVREDHVAHLDLPRHRLGRLSSLGEGVDGWRLVE
mmetsp:Transcript_3432/g.11018  ORF Transcript_3432/g.11018 Transcript_3432/m.11018 type:complete len:223 (+) Transcript_3432:220-888(+)